MILPGAAMGRVRPVLAALLLACVAVPVAASLAAPEIPLRTPEMLRSGATHVVTGTVQRVYLAEEQDGRWEVGEHVAEENGDGGLNVLHPNGFERLAPLARGGPAKPGSADRTSSPR